MMWGDSVKSRYILLLLFAVFLTFFVLLNIMPPRTDDDIYRIQGSHQIYYGSENIKLTDLNDPLFTDSEYAYNHSLAKKSLLLAISAFSSEKSDKCWGEDASCGREDDVKNTLQEYGFGNIEFYGYDASLNDTSSKAAFAIGEKLYSSSTSIIAIAIRGGNYGLEWADNFNLGDSSLDYHLGFYTAAQKIKEQTDQIIPKLASGRNVKLWITGYSRGGAVANLLASMYDAKKDSFPCQVYAYTFASPKSTVIENTKAHDTVYRNIFNILSPNDPVYNIPPDMWGFGRFGICVKFPHNESIDYVDSQDVRKKVAESYFAYTGKTLVTTGNSVNNFLNVVIKSSKSRDFFSKYLSGPISDLIIVKMSKYEDISGAWVPYKQEEILYNMYGIRGTQTLQKVKNNEFFSSMEKLGIYIPEDFYLLVALCRINGFDRLEDMLFSNLKVSDLDDMTYITSSDLIYTGHSTFFYRSWLENVPISLLTFTKE